MQMYGYGEDALTLWALRNRLDVLLRDLGDNTDPRDCRVFYRPSFGRSGGENSPQFGEFDFIILSREGLYLGESKWDRGSLRIKDGVLLLRGDQTKVLATRHNVFKAYVREWAFGDYQDWDEFKDQAAPEGKPVPSKDSLLATNLRKILGEIRGHYDVEPKPENVLLYFYCEDVASEVPSTASNDFTLVAMKYEPQLGNYVEL